MITEFERKLAACLLGLVGAWALSAMAQSDPRAAAFTLEQEGKTAEAEAAWTALARQYPSNPEPYAHIGLLEARQEHYPEAIANYKKAMALAPSMPGLRGNLGLAYYKAGDYREAIREFDPMLKAQPDDQRLTILIGLSHYGINEFAAAIPYLKQASEKDPQNLTLLLTLAHSCLFAHQYQCVLDSYHSIIALNAESAEADMLVGEALDEMKDHEGAIREFRAAISADPQEPNAHFGLGYLLWTKGQYPEAAKEFQAEVDNDPHHLQAIYYLADSEIQMNQEDAAKPLLEQLVMAAPGNERAHLDLGIVLADQGSKDGALREFQTAAKLSPDDVNVHWRLGRLYRTMGKTAEAKAEFDKAKTLNKSEDERLLKVMSKIPASPKKPNASDPK
ncbi:MAG TPA: tetratricopeptide repeat protein [Terracidiphilus sp.]|nr:tetratricopeptide repeat protein [Terracidiphilus sp.]